MAEKIKQERFVMVEVPTQTTTMIEDVQEVTEEKKYYTLLQAVTKIMNDINDLKKLLN